MFTVTLNIYSGRSFPAWKLTDLQVLDFYNYLEKMPSLKKDYDVHEIGLGYRGFIVEEKLDINNIIKRFEIYKGRCKIIINGNVTELEDPHYTLERFLLSTIHNRLDKNLIQFLNKEINNR